MTKDAASVSNPEGVADRTSARRGLVNLGVLVALSLASSAAHSRPMPAADQYAVVWDSPGTNYKDSMPIGNGDLGLNLWTEQDGDVVFLIGKTDAWTENGQLVKLGRVRVSLSPSPFTPGALFKQVLRPREGVIEVRGSNEGVLRAWVDASAPVVHLEMSCGTPVAVRADLELWRSVPRVTKQEGAELFGRGPLRELNGIPDGEVTIDPDTVLPARNDRLTWFHRNTRSTYPLVLRNQNLDSLLDKYPDPLLHRTFGMSMKGPSLVSDGNRALKSSTPLKDVRLSLYAHTAQTPSVEAWQAALDVVIGKSDATDLGATRKATRRWWDAFWERSHIIVTGDDDAEKVTQGYAMQRWMTGTSGLGAMPLQYNGSIFAVGQEPAPGTSYDPAKGRVDPDYRDWGGNYWFQNQRLVYWPMIANGDLDTLAPFYKMYTDALPLMTDRTKLCFKHDGSAFLETMYFFGLPNNCDFGWGNKDFVIESTWIRHHTNSALELTTMLLDTFAQSQDRAFARKTLMPVALAATLYYDQHWKRVDGKIHMDPNQALETRQQAVNPAPDVAGLMHVLPRLIAIPEDLATPAQRAMWRRMLAALPPLARGRTDAAGKDPETLDEMTRDGKEVLLCGDTFSRPKNVENPELYSIFPYRLFGVNRGELELARATYDARRFESSTCWGQDGIQAACLGLSDRAQAEVIANFTTYGDGRFPWFWAKGHDWQPDLDNGGAGQLILQNMLMQMRGDEVLLFPAWPKEWNVDFKLHAPRNTVIEGVYRNGKVERLIVTPASRETDVRRMSPQ